MNWRDQLQPGKFRDAAFSCTESGGELGRQVVVHEYPGRDDVYPEDVGGKPKPITLQIYVIGPDYMVARQALIRAINTPGPGTLIHPWRGSMQVSVLSATGPKESTREGGMASFSVTFIKAGKNEQPSSVPDTSAKSKAKADAALVAVQSGFVQEYSVDGFPEFVAQEAEALLQQALGVIEEQTGRIPGVPEVATNMAEALERVSGDLSVLIRDPAKLAMESVGLISGLGDLVGAPVGALGLYRNLWSFGDDIESVITPTVNRQRQADNQASMVNLMRQTAVIEATRVISRTAFVSYQEAVAVRDEVADRLDLEAETATDEVYQALMDLRVALVLDVNTRGADLARILHHTPVATLPALVVAHQLYGDAAQEAEILTRNDVRHPGFVPGGETLEVLSHV